MTEVKFSSDITVELIEHMGSEMDIVRAARVSTLGAKAEPKEAEGLLRFLVREGHTSPLEHVVMTFRIHMPLFVQNQLVRHRMASFNIESGRYRELEPEFYIPENYRPVRQVGKTGDYQFEYDAELSNGVDAGIRYASQASWDAYEDMLEHGVAKEVARMVLPVNIFSTAYMTVNLHSALNIIRLRTTNYGSKPQFEIAEVGDQIENTLMILFPTVHSEFARQNMC